MGLINHDVFEANNGVQKTDSYISFANETLYLRKHTPMSAYTIQQPVPPSSQTSQTDEKQEQLYNINANYRIYWDVASREAGKTFIDTRSINAQIKESQLCSNLYEVLYELLRQKYPNTTNA